jgi:putative transposase
VKHVQKQLEVSERRACGALDQPRSSQRYQSQPREGEAELVKRMLALSRQHPRYGYRFVWALLRGEGFKINRKRVYRLWRREGLKVPVKRHKKRRLGTSKNGINRLAAMRADHVWTWDFIHDRTEDGRPLKWLSVVDEFTRECLALEVRRSFKSGDVIDVLKELFLIRGVPQHIRSDNGPEFIAQAIKVWLVSAKVSTLDGFGNPLPLWIENRVLKADEFFVFSDRVFNSFDSRCYGPVIRHLTALLDSLDKCCMCRSRSSQ